MNHYKEVILRRKKDESLRRFHPWVFSGAIDHLPADIEEGEVVKVLADDRSFLGTGHYQNGSIAVRILSFDDESINRDFYVARIAAAFALRKKLGLLRTDNNTFRLIHGEGDYLPGLVVDIYGHTAVMQAHSIGMHRDRHLIVEALAKVLPSDILHAVFYKSEGTLPANIVSDTDGYLMGSA
ncbi:MAG TPA: RlmI/RlmK family 23S rRNA methyltransferase, partial [Porphyromonadaceae bacterium]|nr:RlmI/RlmK family 23S rRNA methyltransferase [Porphyromonadaceae bacterium]